MASSLPRFMVLKSNYNNKYLRYVHEDGQPHGHLQFNGEEAASPYAKFELEMPASDEDGLVHLKCCYNNKYWVRSEKKWITATSDHPEEDRSKASCTLFQPIYVDRAANTIRLLHVQSKCYGCLWRAAAPFASCMYAGFENFDRDSCDIYTVIDWETFLFMPKYVAFKGDNEKYLSAEWIEGYPYLQFSSDDKGSPTVANEIVTTGDGNIRIKSMYFNKFWRRSPNWIWGDSDDTTNNNSDTLFEPVKVNDTTVALRNLGNNNFCKRLTTEGKTSCLNAAVSAISIFAQLKIEELVLSREIYNIKYRFKDASIYNQSIVMVGSNSARNDNNEPSSLDVKVGYKVSRTSTWKVGVSFKLGVKTSVKAGIPCIVDGKVELSAEIGTSFELGGTQTWENQMETVYKVPVPGRTKAIVNVVAKIGTCDVPFSYVQRDSLFNGSHSIENKFDGVYTGANYFNFDYETLYEKL